MGGWLFIVVSLVNVLVFWWTGHWVFFGFATIGLLLCFWSFGVMHNFAYGRYADSIRNLRENGGIAGLSVLEIEEQVEQYKKALPPTPQLDAVPNWITWLNMLFSVFSASLFVVAMVYFFRG